MKPTKRSRGAPPGNTNAARANPKKAQIGPFRCTPEEKAKIEKAANGNLSEWALPILIYCAENRLQYQT